MSKGQTKKTREAAGNRRKLTRAEKKQIAAVIRQAKGDGKAHTAQQTIPYLAMYPDGICKVAQRKYSKSIAFEDINYQLAQADDKTAIFENWCDFLNYFDASVNVQLSFINQGSQQEQAARAIHIPPQNDDFNSIRTEYSDMLKTQLAKGNNGLVKHKYITFSIEADNPAAARARLSRIETDVLNNFKVLGVSAHPLSGYERLKVLHGVFHPAGEPFSFSYDWLTTTGLTTKDFIAPSSFKFGEGRYFAMGKKTGAVSFLEILAPELNDRILNVKLTNKPIASLAEELLNPQQFEMFKVYLQTQGNKPLIFGGGSPDGSPSEDLSGVEFVNGTRPGNQELMELAKQQVGNVGGYPYWSWYGFNSRVEWCACFVSWCYNQAGKSEPRFAGCEWQGVPWFQSRGQWGARGYENIAPGDAIFFDWDLDGVADHVGLVLGRDESRVYTVEGNSGDACKIKSYDLNYQCIKGYGLMNW